MRKKCPCCGKSRGVQRQLGEGARHSLCRSCEATTVAEARLLSFAAKLETETGYSVDGVLLSS